MAQTGRWEQETATDTSQKLYKKKSSAGANQALTIKKGYEVR